jgi:hypothetical protein
LDLLESENEQRKKRESKQRKPIPLKKPSRNRSIVRRREEKRREIGSDESGEQAEKKDNGMSLQPRENLDNDSQYELGLVGYCACIRCSILRS